MNSGFYSYSFGNTLGMALLVLTKLLILVLAVVFILGIAAWIKETFLKNQNSRLFKDLNEDPVIKNVVMITASIIGLVLVFALIGSLFQPSYGFRMNMNGYNMNGYNMGANYGVNSVFSISGILSILIRILTFVLIISLILAAVVYLKEQYESGKLRFPDSNKVENTGNTTVSFKDMKGTENK